MLLKSIKLENFRQFRNESIDFAQGENGKNVTIIIGENGTGKTTFAQAFFWCMYGETEFSDKIILNKIVASEMTPGRKEKVRVTLSLHHGDVDYKLIREQTYHKDYANNIKGDNTVFDIEMKDAGGNTSFIKKLQCELEIKKILPKELSRYFFFDGERIEKMSKDISTGKKATDFAEAVKGLLGLNAMISAINHFNPRSSLSVIGSYEKSFNSKSNKKIEEYTAVIEKSKARLEEIDARLEELDSQIAAAQTRRSEKTTEIKQYSEGEKLQEEREKLQQEIRGIVNMRANVYKAICKDFNSSMSSFISLSLMKRALELLAEHDFVGKDIPYMHQKTIEYLLRRKVCICGTHLDEGSVPYNKVKELINYLPPQSISTTVADFKKEAKTRAGKLTDLPTQIQENLATISMQTDDITDKTDELHAIEAKLSGGDVREKVRAINNEIQICNDTITKSNAERDRLNRERGGVEKEMDHADSERQNLTLLDESNKKTQMYLTYAKRIYDELKNVYQASETKIRERLQNTINDIFKQIYEGDLSLTIDSKYHITVQANDYEGDVETSTAQSISVIFAFITAIIKMARENRNATDEDAKLLSSEPYPLVMDAPLSAFDKRRIKTVCEALPETAEQVIIFIKDTDGELAEEYMGDRIGSRHQFDKKNEFETVLI
ncbi:MAG: AAA family ATPase [Oscillospiraceae bacterium]|jgi:DNA sulfur modification protein DndD|nr:AAA family ATPase [Oscillospiraceae bacterium]